MLFHLLHNVTYFDCNGLIIIYIYIYIDLSYIFNFLNACTLELGKSFIKKCCWRCCWSSCFCCSCCGCIYNSISLSNQWVGIGNHHHGICVPPWPISSSHPSLIIVHNCLVDMLPLPLLLFILRLQFTLLQIHLIHMYECVWLWVCACVQANVGHVCCCSVEAA